MKGMILAAGLGTRLRPLTEDVAKPSLPVVNVPMILFSLHLLRSAGVREVYINLHYEPESVKKVLGSGRKFRMKIEYGHEPQILGTGGAIKKAQDFFGEHDFVVVNGDSLLNCNLEEAVQMHVERHALATMVVRADKRAEHYGIIGLDAENRIRRFTNLVRPERSDLRKFMFTGVHILSPGVFEYLPPAIEVCINQYAYPRMLANNEPVFGHVAEGYWSDLGTIASYFETNMHMLRNPGLFPYFDPLASYEHRPKIDVDRVVRMGKKVDLKEGAKIVDPVVIADGCKIGKNAVVGPHVILGEKTVVASGAHIEEAILFARSSTEEGEKLERVIRTPKLTVRLDEPPSKQQSAAAQGR